MASREFEQIAALVRKLSRDEQLSLIELLAVQLQGHSSGVETPAEAEVWNDEKLQQMLNAANPMTTQEIVAAGLFGGWEDAGIEDSQTWVDALRNRTRGRHGRWVAG